MCLSVDDENLPILRAQWRNIAKALMTQNRVGSHQDLLSDSSYRKSTNLGGASLVSLQSVYAEVKKRGEIRDARI